MANKKLKIVLVSVLRPCWGIIPTSDMTLNRQHERRELGKNDRLLQQFGESEFQFCESSKHLCIRN